MKIITPSNALVKNQDGGSHNALLPQANLTEGPRESMRRLPKFMQPMLTALTGRPLKEENPLIEWSPVGRVVSVILMFVVSIIASIAILSGPIWAWPLLPISMIFTAGAARSFQIGIVHHASHATVTGYQKIDTWLGEIASAVVLISPLSVYRQLHTLHHSQTASDFDVDLLMVLGWGFKPGMSVAELWKQVWSNLFGIKFHWNYAKMRLAANFGSETIAWRRRLAFGIHGTMIVLWLLVAYSWNWGFWTILAGFLAYLIPVFPLFQIAGLLQTFTEHQWVWIASEFKTKKVMIGELTFSRYSGEEMPELIPANGLSFVVWVLKMAFIHWPIRVLVLQLDLPNHSFHHRYPKSFKWAMAAFAQRDDELKGIGTWGPYREIWGLKGAIQHNFELLASLPPDAWTGEQLDSSQMRDRMGSM